MEYIFVYGTLLKTFNAGVMRSVQEYLHFEGKGSILGQLYDLGQYPGLVEVASATDTITGEVYRTNNAQAVFAVLDEYEGDEYNRVVKTVKLGNQKEINCWVYVFIQELHPSHIKIINGDYLAYIRDKVNESNY
ncbi:gamma-glutamylcyclotransferase family protein [Mucilaginibacter aquatilis]|uniref:Gamma-glutamylcyclotransferase AIG2-like domain-containing protein n=1 Tax=Mucilaginibacter aquatilis TaxID=1517760 RepID=A0A6I4IR92_9SPHI|nr:gamma-glutamylcyclotransferase family protein [Mucilaginibacter aquatilis]MVN92444.1 hypothetical protein [Mucilaginibacter aquatilis]